MYKVEYIKPNVTITSRFGSLNVFEINSLLFCKRRKLREICGYFKPTHLSLKDRCS